MLSRTRPVSRWIAAPALAGLVLATLAGCGSDDAGDEDDARPSAAATTSVAPSDYLEVPAGIALTEPGTALELGEEAVVAYQLRQDDVATVAITVQRIERTTFEKSFPGWNVDAATAARTPYFVRLSVTNLGEEDLGGRRLDSVLWADDGTTLEAANHYDAKQLPVCSGGPLPAAFTAQASAELCQVYFLAPEQELRSISFLPFGGLDAVTWSGDLSPVRKPGKKGGKGAGEDDASPSGSPSGSAS